MAQTRAETCKKWYNRNKDKARAYREANGERIRAYQAEYRRRNKGRNKKLPTIKPTPLTVNPDREYRARLHKKLATYQRLLNACDIAEGKRCICMAKIINCQPGCMPELFAKTGKVDV